jgi:hypothetical protein
MVICLNKYVDNLLVGLRNLQVKLYVLGFSVFLLASCCNIYENSPIAYLSKTVSGLYELELSGKRCVSSHDPISAFFKSEIKVSHYLYLKKRNGKLNSEEFILTYEKGKIEYPYPVEKAKGMIQIDDKNAVIRLEMPVYMDSGQIEKYIPYEFNGTYQIEDKAQ